MAEITFERTDGNLGRLPASEDATSGLLVIGHSSNLSFSPVEYIFTSSKQAKETKENDGNFFNGNIDDDVFSIIYDFFTSQPNATLFVRFSVPSDGNPFFEEVRDIQNKAEGKIRQLAVICIPNTLDNTGSLIGNDTNYDDPLQQIANLGVAAENVSNNNQPLHILYAPKTNHLSTISSLPTIRTNDGNAPERVSVIIGGNSTGATSNTGVNASLGVLLATVSKSKVHENVGWIEKFPLPIDGPTIYLNNEHIKISELTEVDIKTLTEKGYIFPRKYTGISGSYFNDSPTCSVLTSDYAYIENNRTLDKAIRQTRILLLPSLNSPIYLNPDGTLTAKDISRLSVTARKALEKMQRDLEVSNFSIFIDPDQNVLSTSVINIEMSVQPVGVARQLKVKIGFAANVAS